MNKVFLITEGLLDEVILKKLLPKEALRNTQFVVGQGRYSAQSKARSILAAARSPVALVLDADTTELEAIQEQKDFLQEALGQASAGIPFEIFLVVPEIEVLLIESAELLRRLSGRSYSPTELELARLQPKKFLSQLIKKPGYIPVITKALISLDETSLSAIRRHPLIDGLTKFLTPVLQPAT